MTKPINPEVVKAQIASLLLHFPELQDDPESLALSLDSETDATALLSQIIARWQQAKANSVGLANWISDLRARMDRMDRRMEAQRKLMLKIMEIADIRKLELPIATLGISMGPKRVIITDEKLLANQCWRVTREPDKTKIKEFLLQGVDVGGASLSNGEEFLRISVK